MIDCTPLPPALSIACSATVTWLLVQPAPFAAGDGIAVVVGATVSTVKVALPLMLPEVAVMVVVPVPTPVARPVWLIVATPGLLLAQETSAAGT